MVLCPSCAEYTSDWKPLPKLGLTTPAKEQAKMWTLCKECNHLLICSGMSGPFNQPMTCQAYPVDLYVPGLLFPKEGEQLDFGF